MKQRLKKITIIICVCAAILAGVLFGMYKIFVTPEIIVGLALNNARESLESSVELFTDSDEKEVIERIRKNGGKTEMNITVSESSFIEGANAELISNSDGFCTVTEINFDKGLKLETYKDDKSLIINTPLFSGGFEINLDTVEDSMASSVFKERIISSPGALAASAVMAYISGGIDAYGFYEQNREEIASIINGTEVKKNGKATVIIGSKTKSANEYSAHITQEAMDKIVDVLKAYGQELGMEDADLEASLGDMRTDCELSFRIKGFTLYEICIRTENSKRTLSFTGADNQFDTMMYYKDEDTENAIRRYHDRRGNNITEEITIGDKTILLIEKGIDKTEIRIGSGENPFVVYASGKKIDDYTLSYNNLEFGIENRFMLTADLYMSEEYDESFSFNKSGEYIDLFSISADEWPAISEYLLKGIGISD